MVATGQLKIYNKTSSSSPSSVETFLRGPERQQEAPRVEIFPVKLMDEFGHKQDKNHHISVYNMYQTLLLCLFLCRVVLRAASSLMGVTLHHIAPVRYITGHHSFLLSDAQSCRLLAV